MPQAILAAGGKAPRIDKNGRPDPGMAFLGKLYDHERLA